MEERGGPAVRSTDCFTEDLVQFSTPTSSPQLSLPSLPGDSKSFSGPQGQLDTNTLKHTEIKANFKNQTKEKKTKKPQTNQKPKTQATNNGKNHFLKNLFKEHKMHLNNFFLFCFEIGSPKSWDQRCVSPLLAESK